MSEKFHKFTEYLNSKNKIEKPKVDISGDTGPEPDKTPPKPVNKGKGWSNKNALSEKPKPYHPPQTPEKQPKYEKGLAQDGDKKLIYEPKTPETIDKEGGKKVSSWPKTATTNEFLDATQDMDVAELVAYIKTQNKIENTQGLHPVILIDKVAELVSNNPKLLESLIYSLKRNGIKLETTDAPASKTEITKKDLKSSEEKPATPKRTRSIDGNKLDMGNSDVVTTKAKM